MWGGGGGLLEYRASLLASHGYVSFALEYFAPGELESADLELKYFEVCVILLPPVSTFCVKATRCFIVLISCVTDSLTVFTFSFTLVVTLLLSLTLLPYIPPKFHISLN